MTVSSDLFKVRLELLSVILTVMIVDYYISVSITTAFMAVSR